MTYQARETSRYQGQPFELYWFQTNSEGWRLTSGDQSVTYLGHTYDPEDMHRTEIDQTSEYKSSTITVTIPRTHDIASRFVSTIPATPLSLVIYRGHENDPDAEVVTAFTGRVTKAAFGEQCELEVVPENDLLRRTVPATKFQVQCNRVLYGPGCGVDKSLHQYPGTVLTISADGLTITSAAGGSAPAGRLAAGILQKGDYQRMIIAHSGNTIQLLAGIPGLVVGDSIMAIEGCQGTEADCTHFGAMPNHFGFSKIPSRNPFSTNGVV